MICPYIHKPAEASASEGDTVTEKDDVFVRQAKIAMVDTRMA